jgi:glycerophosphoryl diester phosphodiesterase
VVSSFLPEVLHAMHAEDSRIPLGLICETTPELGRWRNLSIECVIPHFKLVNDGLLREFGSAGKKVLVWTVNNPADMQRFTESGVNGIISDDTSLLCRTLAE